MTALSNASTMPGALDIDALVAQIAALQSTGTDGLVEGLFPAVRTHRYLRYAVPDDSVFFTAVTVYTLQQLRADLSDESRAMIDAVTRRAVTAYPRYLNNEGYPMYNFWQTRPADRFFPNGVLLSRFRKFRLPEDIDTTAYIYLTHPHPAEDAVWLKQRLILDANGTRRRIRNTRPAYRSLPAYSTWLGQANMPLDFDVCALSNLLVWIFAAGLPLNAHDHASIRFITSVIEAGDHRRHPFQVAPWYASPAVILYHVARLIAAARRPELDALRPLVARDLYHLLDGDGSFVERLLCGTSLRRLGQDPPPLSYPDDLPAALDRFHFFVGSLLTAIDHPVTWTLAPLPVFHVRYRCRAHTLALLLEHEVFRRRGAEASNLVI